MYVGRGVEVELEREKKSGSAAMPQVRMGGRRRRDGWRTGDWVAGVQTTIQTPCVEAGTESRPYEASAPIRQEESVSTAGCK